MPFRSRIFLIGCFTIVAVVCARLGLWQVHRLRGGRGANSPALAERWKPPVTIPENDTTAPRLINRRVRAPGHYDTAREIILRGRVYEGVPGVEIVSPLLLGSGRTAVLVNRGFVPTPDAVTVSTDSLRELGRVEVEGIALPLTSGRGAPVRHGKEIRLGELDLRP